MPSNHTQNYQLSQWEPGDAVKRTDFNADNAKIDAAIKALDTKADAKADTSAVTSLTGRVGHLEAQMEETGNAMPYIYRYTGRDETTVSIPFNHRPAIVFVAPEDGSQPVVIGFYGVAATNSSDVTFHKWPTSGGMTGFTGIKYNQYGKKYIAIGILNCIY